MNKRMIICSSFLALAVGVTSCGDKTASETVSDAGKATGKAVTDAAKTASDATVAAAREASKFLTDAKNATIKATEDRLSLIEKGWQDLAAKAAPATEDMKVEFGKAKDLMVKTFGDVKTKLADARDAGDDAWKQDIEPALAASIDKAQKLYDGMTAKFDEKANGQALSDAIKAKDLAVKTAQDTYNTIDMDWQALMAKTTAPPEKYKSSLAYVKDKMVELLAAAKTKLAEAKNVNVDSWQKNVKPDLDESLAEAQKLYDDTSVKFNEIMTEMASDAVEIKDTAIKAAQDSFNLIDKNWQDLMAKSTPITADAKAEIVKLKEQMVQLLAIAKIKLTEAKDADVNTWMKSAKPALDAALVKAQKLYDDTSIKLSSK